MSTPWIFVWAAGLQDLRNQVDILNCNGELRLFYHLHSTNMAINEAGDTEFFVTYVRDDAALDQTK